MGAQLKSSSENNLSSTKYTCYTFARAEVVDFKLIVAVTNNLFLIGVDVDRLDGVLVLLVDVSVGIGMAAAGKPFGIKKYVLPPFVFRIN